MNAGPQSSQPIDVAVGIVRDAAGRVLVNQRGQGKPFAGRWEFPGGKIGPGETAARALVRELDEELGITIRWQRRLITFPYRYDELTVRLHVNEVLDYQGVPVGWEGQALDWVDPKDLDGIDLLAANTVIIRAIVLPRVCLITDTARFGIARILERLAKHVEARRVLLIVREKTMTPHRMKEFVDNAREICRPRGSMVCVHADCQLDEQVQTDGVHLPARALEHHALPDGAGLLGVSCHTGGEIRSACERGADYALLSPVKRTASHPDAAPLGWARFEKLCAPASMPVYALGGLRFADLETAIEHDAQGAAILGAAWE